MAKRTMNFKSAASEKKWMAAIHSIPSKSNPNKSVADASPGNTPIKIRGKSVKINRNRKKK